MRLELTPWRSFMKARSQFCEREMPAQKQSKDNMQSDLYHSFDQ
ncbi:hypothetical protein VCRA2120E57_360030 [Vibrio crassostreae]|nr:hypothetical protein VCRA2120E57_360030 [Vibrio crassostreae]